MSGIMTKLGKDGRIVIPAEFRKKMDLKPGDEVMFIWEDGELQITTSKLALKHAKNLVKRDIPEHRDLVAELIEERREEASRE